MKRISIIIALLIAGGVGVLSGVALAQQTNWIALLVEEYSRVWKAAYDETAKHGLPPAGREAVAERVLDAYIAGRVDGVAALPTSTPSATSTLTPTPSPLPSDSGSSSGLSRSDIDGYSSSYEIAINTAGQLLMKASNIHTSGGAWVVLSRGGTLTTDVGTVMEDRYEYSCSVGGGVLWERTTYASDKHNVDLPKTDLNTAPLWEHPTTTLGMQVCAGEQPPPDSPIVVDF